MATLLLKKSYQLSNLKEVTFKNLWGSKGVFTTMRMVGKPSKLLLFKPHIENLIKSSKKYGIRKKNLKNIVIDLIKKNTLYKGPDNLFRVALNKRLISVSIRKRLKSIIPTRKLTSTTVEKLRLFSMLALLICLASIISAKVTLLVSVGMILTLLTHSHMFSTTL